MTAATAPTGPAVVSGAVMFTDIVGFTEFNALRGDGEAIELLALQESIVREELRGESRIVKQLGDGLMLWFADCCEAIEAGLNLQERFEEESWNSDMPLWVRIGVHYGNQTARGEDLLGHDVNVASRIVDLAGSGEVLVSAPTVERADAVADRVEFERLGPVIMRGIPTPIDLYRADRKE